MHRMYNDPQMVRAMRRARTVPFATVQSCMALMLPAAILQVQLCTLLSKHTVLNKQEGGMIPGLRWRLQPAACCSCYLRALQVQRCTLLSIKTGGCPETCNYCAQSSSWSKDTKLKAEKLMDLDAVYEVRLTLCVAASVTDLRQCNGVLPEVCRAVHSLQRAMHIYLQAPWCCRRPASAGGLLFSLPHAMLQAASQRLLLPCWQPVWGCCPASQAQGAASTHSPWWAHISRFQGDEMLHADLQAV